MRVEQVDGEDTYFVGQVTACFMLDAARFGTQLDRLGDLVPITCYGIKLVHIRLDGSFTRVRRVTGGFDQLVDVLSRSEEHTSELKSLLRLSYAFLCLSKNN